MISRKGEKTCCFPKAQGWRAKYCPQNQEYLLRQETVGRQVVVKVWQGRMLVHQLVYISQRDGQYRLVWWGTMVGSEVLDLLITDTVSDAITRIFVRKGTSFHEN